MPYPVTFFVTAYRAKDQVEATQLEAMLNDADIPASVRDESSEIGVVGMRSVHFLKVELIVPESKLARSKKLIDEFLAKQEDAAPQRDDAWVCGECGESVEGNFSSCWNCGGSEDAAARHYESVASSPKQGLKIGEFSRQFDWFMRIIARITLIALCLMICFASSIGYFGEWSVAFGVTAAALGVVVAVRWWLQLDARSRRAHALDAGRGICFMIVVFSLSDGFDWWSVWGASLAALLLVADAVRRWLQLDARGRRVMAFDAVYLACGLLTYGSFRGHIGEASTLVGTLAAILMVAVLVTKHLWLMKDADSREAIAANR